MNVKRMLLSGLIGIGLAALPTVAAADAAVDYPSKPLTIVVAKNAGGIDDTVARLLANYLQPIFGQPVLVENRPGASGIVGTDWVMRAEPDGYTVLLVNLIGQITAGVQQPTPPYDALADFNPISLVATYKNVLASNKSVPAETLPEFIAYAKDNPDTLAFGSGGIGALNHLAIEMLMAETGIDMVHVPYASGTDAVLALNANQIQLYLTDVNSALSGVQMGNVQLLGQAGTEPLPLLADVPMLGDDFPSLGSERAVGIIGPQGIPQEIVEKLNALINEAMANPEMVERGAAAGLAITGGAAEVFGEIIERDVGVWTPVAAEFKSN